MGDIYGAALREDVTKQDSQDIVRGQILDNVVGILAISINRREDVTRRQYKDLPHLLRTPLRL